MTSMGGKQTLRMLDPTFDPKLLNCNRIGIHISYGTESAPAYDCNLQGLEGAWRLEGLLIHDQLRTG